jgi:hypothetical protein
VHFELRTREPYLENSDIQAVRPGKKHEKICGIKNYYDRIPLKRVTDKQIKRINEIFKIMIGKIKKNEQSAKNKKN